MHIPLVHPSSILISGPSGSGKTVFLRKLLLEKMIAPFPTRIVIIYSEWQREYDKLKESLPGIEFLMGPMPSELYQTFSPKENNFLVLDDQMLDVSKSAQLEKFFVQGSHHRNLTVVLIMQNIFEKGKAIRTSNLNANYLVLYKNPRDKGQIGILGRQLYPTKWKQFVAALEDATSKPYTYLLVDLRPETPDDYRLRANIFPTDDDLATNVYIIMDGGN